MSDDDDDNVVSFTVPARAAPLSPEKIEAELQRAANLDDTAYESQRETIAAKLRWRLAPLDDQRKRRRLAMRAEEEALGGARKPSLEPIAGPELVEQLIADLTRYVSLHPDYAATVAFWVLHTYLIDRTRITPRLAITAPEKRCGKTTLID
jgi:putative DNA primase/helicase